MLQGDLEKYITEVLGGKLEECTNKPWSQNAIRTTHAWLKEGLRPRCITRDLKWGVPVPHDDYKDKVNKRDVETGIF